MASEPVSGVRKDGHRPAPESGRSVLVCLLRTRPGPADPGRGDRRAGRLRSTGGSAGGQGDPVPVVHGQARQVHRGSIEDAMSVTPIRTTEEVAQPRPRLLISFDPLLMLAVCGLVACSLVTLKGATRNVMHGQPLYYVERQAIYAAIGLLVALALMQMDYSRLRE